MIKYITIPKQLIQEKDTLHYKLFDFSEINQFKLFLFILAKATMMYKANKMECIQHFEVRDILKDNSVISRKSVTYERIETFVDGLNTPFFETISYQDKKIFFRFSDTYLELMKESKGGYQIDFNELIGIRNIRAAKLKCLIFLYKTSGFFHLYYLFKILDLNKISRRDRKINKIKHCFDSLAIRFDYKYPVNQYVKRKEQDYRFYYYIEDQEQSSNEDDWIDRVFNSDDINLADDNTNNDLFISSSNLEMINSIVYRNKK